LTLESPPEESTKEPCTSSAEKTQSDLDSLQETVETTSVPYDPLKQHAVSKEETEPAASEDSGCIRTDGNDDDNFPSNSEQPTIYHATVVIGAIKKKGVDGKKEKEFFMVLNWWKRMPLVSFSTDYLIECRACMAFREPETDPKIKYNNSSLVAEGGADGEEECAADVASAISGNEAEKEKDLFDSKDPWQMSPEERRQL
jgi:hypothetical protein